MLELLEDERYWLGLDGSTDAGAKPFPHNPSVGSIPACSQESLCTHKQDSDTWLCVNSQMWRMAFILYGNVMFSLWYKADNVSLF